MTLVFEHNDVKIERIWKQRISGIKICETGDDLDDLFNGDLSKPGDIDIFDAVKDVENTLTDMMDVLD